jgi:hypothetical protein
MERATFCYPDSFLEPGHFGVAARVSALVAMAAADDKDPLDDYIEAHVHGVLDLAGRPPRRAVTQARLALRGPVRQQGNARPGRRRGRHRRLSSRG